MFVGKGSGSNRCKPLLPVGHLWFSVRLSATRIQISLCIFNSTLEYYKMDPMSYVIIIYILKNDMNLPTSLDLLCC